MHVRVHVLEYMYSYMHVSKIYLIAGVEFVAVLARISPNVLDCRCVMCDRRCACQNMVLLVVIERALRALAKGTASAVPALVARCPLPRLRSRRRHVLLLRHRPHPQYKDLLDCLCVFGRRACLPCTTKAWSAVVFLVVGRVPAFVVVAWHSRLLRVRPLPGGSSGV